MTAFTPYIVSYHTTVGNYAVDEYYFAAQGMDSPPLEALSEAWAPGTDGPVRGRVVRATLESEDDLDEWRGKLGGAIVLLENTLGGLALLVRDDWAVTVDDVVVGGGEIATRKVALLLDADRTTFIDSQHIGSQFEQHGL